jgi:micrococcal nuclease
VRTPTLPSGVDGSIVSVTDGDTVRVRLDRGIERVRLIGIDTPELHDPRTVVECFAEEAAAHTEGLLPVGTAVRLESDVEARDRYGRVLAYVWRVDDHLFVNEELVADGWAVPYRYPPNVRYADRFSRLGREAREANRGLWGACGGADTPASTTTTAAPPAGGAGDGCDPNYAGACIPISATDLDCSDVQARNFRVVGTDIHHFDGDHDGIACE